MKNLFKILLGAGILYALTDNQKKKINTTAKKGAKAGADAAKKVVKKVKEKFETVEL